MNDNMFGFKILDFLNLQGDCRVMSIDSTVPLAAQELCPADGSSLRTICTFVGNAGKQRMRFGCCGLCGYAGYLDRPTKEWMHHFYLEQWMKHEKDSVSLKNKPEAKQLELTEQKVLRHTELVRLLKKIEVDYDRTLCEIGVGHGEDAALFKEIGFRHVIGVEHSKIRAHSTETLLGISVLVGAFEETVIQRELQGKKPISLFFSRHVLEHVYRPADIIEKASFLQETGDYFIAILPNGASESAMSTLLFLPHLHSFTLSSLRTLFATYSYAVVDTALITSKEIVIIARKSKDTVSGIKRSAGIDEVEHKVRRMIKDMGLSQRYLIRTRRVWWDKNFGAARQSLYFGDTVLDRLYFRALLRCNRFMHPGQKIHSCLVESLRSRYTVSSDSPIEIQFDGAIRLLYK